jgi:hypothetical protein
MKSPFRQIFSGSIRVAKSITFTSIVLGFLLAIGYDFFNKFRDVVSRQGFFEGTKTGDYYAFISIFAIVFCAGIVFFFIERDQSDKAQDELKQIRDAISDMTMALNANTEVLKKIGLSISQTHNKNSATNTQSQPEKQPIDKQMTTKELNNAADKPQNES